jgi:DNA-binding NarL/FixJ family response regulator
MSFSSKKIRIMIVDDHIVMRMGLGTAISGEPDMEIVAEAEDGVEAISAYRKHSPDVVIMDLRMPQQGGIETMRTLREEFKDARVLVYSNFASGDEVYDAFKGGACGYVVKDMPLEQLLKAIRTVHQGEHYIPSEISARIGFRVASNLTSREMEVLSLVAKGMSNKEIGAALRLVEGTVKVHLTNILAKLGVSDRTQAVLAAVRRGIIQIE